MANVRVHSFAVSLDGYAAGPDQSLANPLGIGGERLHEWTVETLAWRQSHGLDGGEANVDSDFIARGEVGIGATLMGRNMFGPIRGEWPDESWRGWWGDEPPYHHPVVVLTHHARSPLEMEGGTTFHFVTDGVEAGLQQAIDLADGQDVRVGGGTSTIQQLLRARLIDELHLAVVPTLLGAGERLFDGLGDLAGYECTELVGSPRAAHVRLARTT